MPDTFDQGVMADRRPATAGEAAVTTVVKVANVIQRGIELLAERSQNNCGLGRPKTPKIRPVYQQSGGIGGKACGRHKESTCPACIVHKIEYPEELPPPECRHHEHTVPSRVGINRQQHLMLLSTPNPNRYVKQRWPNLVERPIHCATFRLAKLAEPRRRDVHSTWCRYAHVLDPYHIDNCRRHVQDLRFTRTTAAVEFFTQKQRYAHYRRLQRHAEIRQLRRQIRALQRRRYAHHVVNILRALFLHTRQYLLANNVQLLTQQRLAVSRYVLQKLCAQIGYVVPKRRSKAFYDTFIVNVADNLAIWLSSFSSNSGYDIREEAGSFGWPDGDGASAAGAQMSKQEADAVPIDEYIDYSTDDVSSTSCSTLGEGEDFSGDGEEGEEGEEGDGHITVGN